jgi:hypothetical protein
MSDWKGDDQSPKKKKPKSKGIPVIPRREESLPKKQESKGWSGKSTTDSVKTTADERSWTKDDSQGSPLPSVSRRRLLLSILIPTGLIALLGFVYLLRQQQPDKIPLYVVASAPGTKFESYAELGMLPLEDLQEISTSVSKVERKGSDFLQSDGAKEPLTGQGPSRFLTYYLQGFLVRDRDGNLGWSGPSSGSPFSGNGPIALKKVFESIASKTAKGSVSIVGLDTQMPMVIHNLPDLSFPAEDIEKIFNDLDPDSKSKLVVFLPCNRGEENWISPEDGTTIFGASFLSGCSTLFGDDALTLEGLENQLKNRVKQWSLTNRKSAQNPVLLKFDTAWEKLKAKTFVSFFGKLDAKRKIQLPGGPGKGKWKARYEKIDQLWSQLDSKDKDLKNRPHVQEQTLLLRASLQSHLLALEEIAEWNPSDDHWNHFQGQVETLEKELSKQTDKSYGVSQIEDQQIAGAESSKDGDPDGLDSLLGKILEQELDRNTLNDPKINKIKQIADDVRTKMWKRWREIQSLACTPRRELSWWLEDRVRELDTSLLKAVDLFVANKFEDCEKEVDSSNPAIDAAREERVRVNALFEFRDNATDFIPDALGLLMRISRFPDAGQYQLEEKATRLATLAVELEKVEAFLGGGPSKAGMDSANAARELQALKTEIENSTIDKWKIGVATDPETLRNLRVALRYRGLTIDDRKAIHGKLVESLNQTDRTNRTDQTDQTDQTDRTNRTNLQGRFLTKIAELRANDPSTPESPIDWDQLLTRDRRWDIGDTPFQPKGYPDLYMENQRIRWLSGPLGMHSLTDLECILEKSSSTQRLHAICDEHECNYLRMQRERLLLARWGTPPDKNPFVDFAKRYEKRSDLIRKESKELNIDWEVGTEKENQLKEDFESATKSLREMRNWLTAKSSIGDNAAPIQFEWTPPKSDDAEGKSLSRLWGSIQPTVKLSGNTVKDVALSLPERKKTEIRIPADAESNDTAPDVIAAFRGHRIRSPVGSEQILFASSFTPTRTAKLTATTQGQTRSMVIMLDCSGSMTPEAVRGAKQTILSLVDLLETKVKEDRSPEGQKFEVSLVIFGILQPISQLGTYFTACEKEGMGLLYEEKSGNRGPLTHIAYTKFFKIGTETREIREALNAPFVKADSNTPLYNSLRFACEWLKGREGAHDLVVLSDGGDFAKPKFERDGQEFQIQQVSGTAKWRCLALGEVLNQFERLPLHFYFYQIKTTPPTEEKYKSAYEEGEKNSVDFFDRIANLKQQSVGSPGKPKIETAAKFDNFRDVEKQVKDDFATPMIQVESREPDTNQVGNFFEDLSLPTGKASLSVIKKISSGDSLQMTQQPMEIELFGGQHAKVRFDNDRLRFESAKALEEDNKFISPLRSENGSLYTLHWDCPRILDGEDAFRLRANLRSSAEDPDPVTYLPWPRFAVGKLTRENPIENQRTLLFSDLGFQEWHYPTIQFGIRQLKDPTWGATDSSLELWWSFAGADTLFGQEGSATKMQVASKLEETFRDYRVTRNATRLRVERDVASLDSEDADGVRWVLCPSARETKREYRGQPDQPKQWKEIFTFTLAEEYAGSEVPLYIVSEKELEELAKNDGKPDSDRLFQYSGMRKGTR